MSSCREKKISKHGVITQDERGGLTDDQEQYERHNPQGKTSQHLTTKGRGLEAVFV